MTKHFQPSLPVSREQQACLSTTRVVSLQQKLNFQISDSSPIFTHYIQETIFFLHALERINHI